MQPQIFLPQQDNYKEPVRILFQITAQCFDFFDFVLAYIVTLLLQNTAHIILIDHTQVSNLSLIAFDLTYFYVSSTSRNYILSRLVTDYLRLCDIGRALLSK